jgi:hypothetical protein
MLALAELEALAAAYRRDRAWRKMTPRAAAARDDLDRARRALAQAADAVAELDRHELALAGASPAETRELHQLLESWSAKCGGAACEIDALGLNGRRRLLDYTIGSPKFCLIRAIADRLDGLGVPSGGGKDAGPLYAVAHEVLVLADEAEPSRGLSKVVADVLDARKNRPAEGGVHALMTAAE